MDGWNVKTLKCYGSKAEDDKLHNGWASEGLWTSKVQILLFFFAFSCFCLLVGYMILMVCYSWERCY